MHRSPFLIAALCAVLCPPCFGQAPALQAGTAEAYSAILRAAREAQADSPNSPAGPHATRETLRDFLTGKTIAAEIDAALAQRRLEHKDAQRKRDRKRVAELAESIRALERMRKAPPAPIPVINLDAIQTGDVGMLEVPANSTAHGTDRARTFRVVQVLDAKNMLASATWKDTLLWVSGYDTQDLTDDASVVLSGYWEVAGTKQYTSTLGAVKTVFEIRPFDILPFLPDPDAAAPKEAEPEPKAAELRIWSDATGRFQVPAEFRGMIGGQVKLRTQDGRELAVPLDRLSPKDREFIQNQRD